MSQEVAVAPSRVLGIDVARGIALLGIFFVNAALFGQPFGIVFETSTPADEGWFSLAIYWFTSIFCGGKFYPLFSILFGAGLAMMFASAQRRGQTFEWNYLRRILLLAIFGMAHIVFLWYGDILLIYAMIAIPMIFLARLRPKTLVIIGSTTFAIGMLLMTPTFVLLSFAGADTEQQVIEKAMPAGDSPIEQYFKVFADWNQTEPFDSRLIELETQIMSGGPYWATVVVRLVNYLISIVFVLLVMFWVIFPCFCFGAALMKSGFFHGERKTLRSKFIVLGVFLGIPLAVYSAWASTNIESMPILVTGTLGMSLCGPVMALMYLSLILNWAESGIGGRFAGYLANMGRMALTCYLLESLLMSAVMQHWGLARYGNNTWSERFLWVLAIYGIIMIFANIWQTRFRQGPLEFIWRKFTYWKRGQEPFS
jgi:uncharacterized protein